MRRTAENAGMLTGAAISVVLFASAAMHQPDMAQVPVILDLLNGNAALGVIAVGMTLVILTGGIDLSVGSVFALSATLTAVLTAGRGCPPTLAFTTAIAAGALLGAGSGWVITTFRIAPFIVTLAGMFLARGLALSVSLTSLGIEHPAHQRLVEFSVPIGEGRLHLNAMIFVLVLLTVAGALRWTAFGRYVYAAGGAESAARVMGLPTGRTKIAVYALSGACAGLAGVMRTLEMSSGDPTAGVGLELEAVAAVVIGGTLLTGGVGGVAGTLTGVLALATIQTWIMFDGRLSSWWAKVATGGLLLAFVLVQRALARKPSARIAGSAA
ncbi:MAG: Inner membrane ABC transporter permease protein YjfF [Phycisphaerae bacterium]|nr:Inner membrane ABC transporter permease protein YjfF [Phycisphaerae bacterium]